MEKIEFERLDIHHGKEVMVIFNYYVENSFSAYYAEKLPDEFFGKIIELTKGYPAHVIKVNDKTVGFCFIRAYNPIPAFLETAEITYFIHRDFAGKGLGKMALALLEEEAKAMGIRTLLASISSKNGDSLAFHKKAGFTECGRFQEIGKKFGKRFDMVWMAKNMN
jgi:phosphinothricin acetyltransferase